MAKVAWRLFRRKLGADLVGTGTAIEGRLFEIALREKVPIWTDAPALELIGLEGRIAGVRTQKNGRELRIEARLDILLNSGGFGRNKDIRDQFLMRPNVNMSQPIRAKPERPSPWPWRLALKPH